MDTMCTIWRWTRKEKHEVDTRVISLRKRLIRDVNKYSASLPETVYLNQLVDKEIISDFEAECSCILFKSPSIEAGDRVGRSALVDVLFPCPKTYAAVEAHHANIRKETDRRFYYYTLAIFPPDISFDNRVFSDGESLIDPFESMAESVRDKDIDETVTHWHAMWRIAISSTGMLKEEEEEDTIKDRKKKRRESGWKKLTS